MNRQTLLHKLEELIEAPPNTLRAGDSLEAVGTWDSITAVGLQALLHEHFDMTLPVDRISTIKTPHDIIVLLGHRIED